MKDTNSNGKLKGASELRRIIRNRYFSMLAKQSLIAFDTADEWVRYGLGDLSELADDLFVPDSLFYEVDDSTEFDEYNDLLFRITGEMEDLDKKLRRKARQGFKALKCEILAME